TLLTTSAPVPVHLGACPQPMRLHTDKATSARVQVKLSQHILQLGGAPTRGTNGVALATEVRALMNAIVPTGGLHAPPRHRRRTPRGAWAVLTGSSATPHPQM